MADVSEEGELADSPSVSDQEDQEETENTLEEQQQWTTIVKGPRKRKLSDKTQSTNVAVKKKKRKRTPLCYDPSEDPAGESTVPPVPEPAAQSTENLNQNQKGLLRYISDISSCLSNSSPYKGKHPIATEYKTADFQNVLRHVLTGTPIVIGKKGKLVHVDLLRRSKVVVVWLACFSRDDYKDNADCLNGVKTLFANNNGGNNKSSSSSEGTGSVVGEFSLLHPGSDKFAHFGLETFMELEHKDNSKVSTPASIPPHPLATPPEPFTRRHCLLSHQQLIEHEFPLPSELHPLTSTNDHTSLMSDSISDQTPLSEPALISDHTHITSNDSTCSTSIPNVPDYITLMEAWPDDINECLKDSEIDTYPIYAIDCEMIKTEYASELARVSIINEDLTCVYTSLVKPTNQVVDYLTRFSGVTQEMLADVQVTLSDVHVKLREILPSKCILIGHSLENDLEALRLHHPYIIDTALLFTPLATPRSKLSLKRLVKKLLNKDIQTSEGGHDPTEDAQAAMELVKKKLVEGRKCIVQFNSIKKWLPTDLINTGVSTKIIDKQSLCLLYTDRSEHHSSPAPNDLEAVNIAKKQVQNDTLFTFVQLHSLEYLRRDIDKEISQDELDKTLKLLDTYTCDIINACTSGTLMFVVCGSSNIKFVRELQRNPGISSEVLKVAVKKAREGMVLFGWK